MSKLMGKKIFTTFTLNIFVLLDLYKCMLNQNRIGQDIHQTDKNYMCIFSDHYQNNRISEKLREKLP